MKIKMESTVKEMEDSNSNREKQLYTFWQLPNIMYKKLKDDHGAVGKLK